MRYVRSKLLAHFTLCVSCVAYFLHKGYYLWVDAAFLRGRVCPDKLGYPAKGRNKIVCQLHRHKHRNDNDTQYYNKYKYQGTFKKRKYRIGLNRHPKDISVLQPQSVVIVLDTDGIRKPCIRSASVFYCGYDLGTVKVVGHVSGIGVAFIKHLSPIVDKGDAKILSRES